ncbi:VWA domain-containing protein [Bifidobacterium sp. ESL0745]|uniref:vWA domain-containing protein n=1 Tax=Bifidobacterium sp. ESL0745 TaxID=2983226 RepID=UPI0023F7766D|nr:VWA domain-containing protein [Bifidobacterium sp. ESL0745]MDF7665524.1 VWA domain-containing protein [Bifidobacterium sp. ESL0745]
MADPGLMSIYLVLDTSQSMGWEEEGEPIKELDGIIEKIVRQCESTPELADNLQIELMTFSTHANVLLDLQDWTGLEKELTFTPDGATCYGEAFNKIADELSANDEGLARLEKSRGAKHVDPVVFFITDGQPGGTIDDHPAETAEQRDAAWNRVLEYSNRSNVNFFALGLGLDQEARTILEQYHCGKHGRTVAPEGGEAQARAQLAKFISLIVESATRSAIYGIDLGEVAERAFDQRKVINAGGFDGVPAKNGFGAVK